MAIGLKTKSDIKFTRDVLESLGEWKRAARMARAMIDRYSAHPDGQEAVNAYRDILTSAMAQGDLPREERAAECDKLFTGYLTVKERASAAEVLLDIAEVLARRRRDAAFGAANKCIELFADTTDPNVATQVKKAFGFALRLRRKTTLT